MTDFPLPGSAPAVVAVPAPGEGPGFWAGAPSATFDDDGGILLAYRVRNGHDGNDETVVARSDDGERFETVVTLDESHFGAMAVERPALVRIDGGWRLYVCCATPNSKHWWIGALEAPELGGLGGGETRRVFDGDENTAVKDPCPPRRRRLARVDLLPPARHPGRGGPDEQRLRHERRRPLAGTGTAPCSKGGRATWDARGARVTTVLADGRMAYDGRATAEENWFEKTGLDREPRRAGRRRPLPRGLAAPRRRPAHLLRGAARGREPRAADRADQRRPQRVADERVGGLVVGARMPAPADRVEAARRRADVADQRGELLVHRRGALERGDRQLASRCTPRADRRRGRPPARARAGSRGTRRPPRSRARSPRPRGRARRRPRPRAPRRSPTGRGCRASRRRTARTRCRAAPAPVEAPACRDARASWRRSPSLSVPPLRRARRGDTARDYKGTHVPQHNRGLGRPLQRLLPARVRRRGARRRGAGAGARRGAAVRAARTAATCSTSPCGFGRHAVPLAARRATASSPSTARRRCSTRRAGAPAASAGRSSCAPTTASCRCRTRASTRR